MADQLRTLAVAALGVFDRASVGRIRRLRLDDRGGPSLVISSLSALELLDALEEVFPGVTEEYFMEVELRDRERRERG